MIAENVLCITKLFLGYLVLFLILPAICLKSAVREKPLRYRVAVYQMTAFLYVTFWGFTIAYLRLWFEAVLWIVLVILPLFIKYLLNKRETDQWFRNAGEVISNCTLGFYSFRYIRFKIREWFSKKLKCFYRDYLQGNILLYIALAGMIAFTVSFFGNYKLNHSAYAYTDEETHLFWIQSLIHNQPFPVGLYPHTMHFTIAAFALLFKIPVVTAVLNFSVLSVTVSVFAAFLYIRALFPAKSASIASMVLFLLTSAFKVKTYFRFQFTVPMEFSFIGLMFTLMFLADCILTCDKKSIILFGMSIAMTFEMHFYSSIFTVFAIIPFFIIMMSRMFRKKIFWKMIASGLLGILVALIPFIEGFLCGYTFERSISWGLDTAGAHNLTKYTGEDVLYEEEEEEEEESVSEDERGLQTVSDFMEWYAEEYETGALTYDTDWVTKYHYKYDLELAKVTDLRSLINFLAYTLLVPISSSMLYSYLILGLFVFAAAASVLDILIHLRDEEGRCRAALYLTVTLVWLFSSILAVMELFNLPQIIESTRSATYLSWMTIPLIALPFQWLAGLFSRNGEANRTYDSILSLLVFTGFFWMWNMKQTKPLSSLYYEFVIPEGDMRLAMDAVTYFDKNQWTVISPTNDLSAIRYDGFHYEIIDLLEQIDNGVGVIRIPSKDVYVFTEKKIPNFNTSRGETRLIDGSDYLKYANEVDPELALIPVKEMNISELPTRDRVYFELRQTTMSKMYYWMEKFREVYPNEVSIYYEDDICAIYHIRQDPYFLLNFSLDYSDLAQRDAELRTAVGGQE